MLTLGRLSPVSQSAGLISETRQSPSLSVQLCMRTVAVGVIERLHPPELLQGRREVAPVINRCAQRVVGLDEEVGVADTPGELHELFAEVVSGLNVSLHEGKGSQPE